MTNDDLRAAMRKRFQAMSMKEWCRLSFVNDGHVSQWLNGKRVGPPHDMLRALNMRIDYVKIRKATK